MTIAISINEHELDRLAIKDAGEHEYTHPAPEEWVQPGQPVTIALDVTPPLATSGGELGILLHSIGFKK